MEGEKLTRAEMAARMGMPEDVFTREIEEARKREPIRLNRVQRRALERAKRRKGN